MRKRASTPAEGQLEFDFAAHVEALGEATDAIRRLAGAVCQPIEPSGGEESEEEMVIEITAACKQAIRESGLSREQVLDRVNMVLGRTGTEEAKKPISIHMFNNYLSKPHEARIPYVLAKAIGRVTCSKKVAEAFISGQPVSVISTDDQIELWLGKWEHHKKQGEAAKKQLLKSLSGREG